MELIDAPPLPNDDANTEGVIRIAVAGGVNWQGAAIYRSIDSEEDYRLLVGLTNHPLANWYDKSIRITADNGSFTGGVLSVNVQLLKPHGAWAWD